jgi:hypothetical protein
MDRGDWFADPLGGLGDAAWDELAGDRFYSSAFWLRVCDLEGGGVAGGVHGALSGGGHAAVPVLAVGDNPHPNVRWADLLAARGLPSPPSRGLLVGHRRGYLAHLLATPRADPVEAAAVVLAAVRRARPPVPDAPARVALYLTTPDVQAWRAAGVRAVPVALAADAQIEIPDGGRETWLRSLGPHRARRVRSEARRFERAGYRVEHRALGESYADVARLAFRTEQRHRGASDPAPYLTGFRRQGEMAGARAEVLLCSTAEGRPVGCCLFYRHRGTVYLRAVGFDYEGLAGAFEYPTLAYYLPAGLPGVRRLHAGIESPEAKALRGARLRPLWLLDLSERSPLEECADEVRAHNAAYRERLAAIAPTVAAAMHREDWEVSW